MEAPGIPKNDQGHGHYHCSWLSTTARHKAKSDLKISSCWLAFTAAEGAVRPLQRKGSIDQVQGTLNGRGQTWQASCAR